jgi:hypothetical protein
MIRAETDSLELRRGRILDVLAPLDNKAQSIWDWATGFAIRRLIDDHQVDFIEAVGSHPRQIAAFETNRLHERAVRGIWFHDPLGRVGLGSTWLTSLLDKDNAHRGSLNGPP